MSVPILKIGNVSKIYPNGTKANDQISLDVYPGEIVGIIGPNGSGKTTLLRQVLGLLKPSEGRIFLKGSDIAKNQELIQKVMSYVPQAPISYESLSIEELLHFVLRLEGLRGEALRQRVKDTLITLDLEEHAKQLGYQLSGGLRKATLLAIAWAKQSELIVMDEPTAMVDIMRKYHFWNEMRKMREAGRSILLASHDLNEIKKICDRMYILVEGKIAAGGAAKEMSAILQMPVEIQFVPANAENSIALMREKSIPWEQDGTTFTVAFREPEVGLSFISNLIRAGGVEQLSLEFPAFEKGIKQIIQDNRSKSC